VKPTTRRQDERETGTPRPDAPGPGDAVLLDLLEEGVIVHAPDGAVVSWNAAADRILAFPGSRLSGSPTFAPGHELLQEDGTPLACEQEPAQVALRTGEPCRSRIVRFRRPGGETAWLLVSAAPLPAQGFAGRPGAVTAMLDITERRAAEQRARGAHRMEAIGRLAGAVAHDFNNLLTAILGYNELLLRGLGATDPRRNEAEQVRLAAQRATGLTRQLLAFSRQQVLEPRVLDLGQVLGDVQPILRRLVGEDVRLQLQAVPGVGLVRGDRTQLEQIVLNLVINARDAMPTGGAVRVTCARVELDQVFEDSHPGSRAGQHVLLSVEDDGCGMDEHTQAHIFEPFFTTKPADRGTGLGLATVYGIVKQSGGYIGVESAPGRGSAFRVYLPLCADALPSKPRQVPTGHGGDDSRKSDRDGGAPWA
jgi:PAS domain S-box-containing protein